MAKNPCIFFVTFFTAFCCLQSTSNAQTAQTSSEVTALLNSYSKPLNLTMGREFLAKVHDSELGLCVNLTNNETDHKTSIANTSLASLHVRITNYSSLKNRALQFPCLHCANLTNTSPNARFVLDNETVENITCLAGSRFAEDFQVTQQSPFRLSDVLSLSIIDANMSFVNLSRGESVHLEMPLVRLPNTSRVFQLRCVTRPLHTSQWSISSCTTNQTFKQDNQTYFVQCNCSALGYYAVFVHYSDLNGSSPWNNGSNGGNLGGNPGGNSGDVHPTPYTGSYARLSLSIDADCAILSNSTTKADFLNSTRYSIAHALNVSVDNIINMVANCGSIVVNFTLISPDGTNGTLNAELVEFSDLVRSDSLKVPVENTLVFPLTLGITANYNLTIPTSIVSLYYIRKTATTLPVTTQQIQPLKIDYTPFMLAVAVLLLVIVTCICGTCCAHSWYLRKKKYTEFNSDKMKPKVEEPVVEEEEEEVTPPEFPMTFTERPKVDERKMSKYDWARTSFEQEQSDTSAFLTGAAAVGPRLIMDCDSDDESDSPHPPGDVAINMEDISEESESYGGSGDSTSEEDEGEDDPRNYECEDNLDEGGAQSRASLPRAEDEITQEREEHENEERQEGENREGEEGQTEKGQSNENDQDNDDRRNEEENQNPDDDVNNDVRQDDDVRDDDTKEDDVKDDDITQDDDVTKDDVTQDDNKDYDGINEDLEDTPPRAPSRNEGASSRMSGVTSRNGGMPEPSL